MGVDGSIGGNRMHAHTPHITAHPPERRLTARRRSCLPLCASPSRRADDFNVSSTRSNAALPFAILARA
jgi:hypothetical protein